MLPVRLGRRAAMTVARRRRPTAVRHGSVVSASALTRRTEVALLLGRVAAFEGVSAANGNHSLRGFASLPPHTPIKMPALSPTMEKGNIVAWRKNEGDELQPGDLMAEVETDKATVDFECQDEGYLAKILVPGGTNDVELGTAVGVMVENKEDVEAFKDVKAEDIQGDEEAAPKKEEKKEEKKEKQPRKEKKKEARKEKKEEEPRKEKKEKEPRKEKKEEQPSTERKEEGGKKPTEPIEAIQQSQSEVDKPGWERVEEQQRVLEDETSRRGKAPTRQQEAGPSGTTLRRHPGSSALFKTLMETQRRYEDRFGKTFMTAPAPPREGEGSNQ